FVVDGNWTTDPTAPQEEDGAQNVNNVLTPDRISQSHQPSNEPSVPMMSGVTADSTTTKLAGDVPKESSKEAPNDESTSADLPGTFPETPANEATGFSVQPIPATSGHGNPINLQPGEKVPEPSTMTSNTVSSTVKDDPSLSKPEESASTFGVSPLPATGGFGNPVNLEPGQKVPHSSQFTGNTINTHVTTDKESYEKGSTAPQLPDVVTPQKERDSKGAGMFNLPAVSGTMIPESSLPMGDTMAPEKDPGAIIQSAGADATTARLAGNVPKEATGLPQMVQESQHEAGTDAEAGHNREAVREKSAMEKELESKVQEAPATSEGAGDNIGSGAAVGGVSAPSHGLPTSVQQSIDEMNKGSAIAPTVPDVVQESISESHVAPEAAGNKAMVGEKRAMEDELLNKVPTEEAAGKPAPATSAALTDSAPAPTNTQGTETASSEPSVVAAAPPAASKGAKSFPTKSAAQPPTISEPAKTSDAPMTTAAAPATTPATARKSSDYSRDVSPMTKTDQQSKPTVTTGLGSSSAPEKSQSSPSQATDTTSPVAREATDKKAKRRSGFFDKIKAKFGDKNKK
ncbi:MAG: hypothetical protein Q9183_003963, partial [Haloplaca sp. 2 TL-2023]